MSDTQLFPGRLRPRPEAAAATGRDKAARLPRPAAVPPPDVRATNSVLAKLAALKTAPVADLKTKWRELFDREPPVYNRGFLEHRLAYRIQELVYGGLKPTTVARLKALADDLDGVDPAIRRQHKAKDRPITGTRLIREYQGVENCVEVRDDGYEYQGRPYQSLSAIATSITGTRWNGWTFFGLKNQRARP